MSVKPKFITFTGVDEHTEIGELNELARQYPIEWGVLFSPKRQGSGRYPPLDWVGHLTQHGVDAVLSAHLCGSDARDVIDSGQSRHDDLIRDWFSRAQINTADPKVQPVLIKKWADRVFVKAILQCRGDFPKITAVDVLFDASGGRGISPNWWPNGLTRLCGYAGGLNPDNVKAAVDHIGRVATEYWIDMETGVRDENDRFSLAKCRAVCEAVYGAK